MTTPRKGSRWTEPRFGDEYEVHEAFPAEDRVAIREVRRSAATDEEGLGPVVGVSLKTFLTSYRPVDPADGPPKAPEPPPGEIAAGSVVRRKSGGPNMDVEWIGPRIVQDGNGHHLQKDWAYVSYIPEYGYRGTVVRDCFPLSCLRVVTVPTE